MKIEINNKIKLKILNDFSQTLYKELNLSLDEFYYYFHRTGLEETIEQMFSDSSVKEIREFLYENNWPNRINESEIRDQVTRINNELDQNQRKIIKYHKSRNNYSKKTSEKEPIEIRRYH